MRFAFSLLVISLLASACADPGESDEAAPAGFYRLEVETVADDCVPARSVQAGSGLAVLSVPRGLVIPYPLGGADAGLVPWARATVLRRASSPILYEDIDCPGVTSTRELEILDETATSLEVALVEAWSGLASCTAPGRPAADCRSERILRLDLEEACEPPCELVPDFCSGPGCTVDDPAWRCACDEPLL